MIGAMLAKLLGWMLLGVVRLLTGAQARWHGCPPKAEQRIYFANHQSHIDLVMIWAALPEELRSITRPIAARDYWANTPFKRWITTKVFNAIYVERGGSPSPAGAKDSAPSQAMATRGDDERIEPTLESNPAPLHETASTPEPEAVQLAQAAQVTAAAPGSPEALAPLQPLIDALQSGDSIIIFPEGTRGHTGEPQKFKSGLYTLAQLFPDVVLVPAWIDNVQRVMPKGEVVPVPILCSVTFGAPVRLEAEEERRAFLDRAREAVVALRAA
ncbi:1-acyl-sn-glycerol-3-phosphate acyltransferase [Burkholderiales bacterium 8X]|nr:1-acyl-sn-glycerol-3-phosphate acyltransferase [Burkholderiales bacterium 8X]